MTWPETFYYSQMMAIIDGQLWEYGVTSWEYKVSRDDMGTVL